MSLRLYADECVDARVIAGVRQRSVDIRTASEEGLLGAPDELHLARAEQLLRVIVTADRDFLVLAHARWQRGEPHPGILFLLPRTPPGACIRRISLLAQVLDPDALRGCIEWIG